MTDSPAWCDDLKREIRALGESVERSISRAIESLTRYDRMLAKAVVADDHKIDQMEVQVEEKCLALLANQRPTGTDLRFVVAVLKINNDLERIGDLAVNIADTVSQLVDAEQFHRLGNCDKMAKKAETMLRDSLLALVQHDADGARKVIAADDDVDELQRSIQWRILQAMDLRPENIKPLMQLNFIIRQLERVGDMATNIAEDVIYMMEGKIVRHESLRAKTKRTSV